jgi:hypothetical protein
MDPIPRSQFLIPQDLFKVIVSFAISYKSTLSLLLDNVSNEFLIEIYDYYSRFGEISLRVADTGSPITERFRPFWKKRILDLCCNHPRLWPKQIIDTLQTIPVGLTPLSFKARINCPRLLLYAVGEKIIVSDPDRHFRRKGLVVRADRVSIDVALYACVKVDVPRIFYAQDGYTVTTQFDSIVNTVTVTYDNVHALNPRHPHRYFNKLDDGGYDKRDDPSITHFIMYNYEL